MAEIPLPGQRLKRSIGQDRRVAHPSSRKQQHDHPARDHGGVYAPVEPQVATTFLYNVSFSASGLPAGATATFSPATLPAAGNNEYHDDGQDSNDCPERATTVPFERLPLALGLLLPLFGTGAVRRRLRHIPPFLGVALFAALSLAAVAGLSGCSGAGLFAARKVPYSITVTATEGTVQRTVEVPLAIQ